MDDTQTQPPNDASPLLAGVRVIDFSRYLPGPFCTLQLAQLGAEVTTVEQPPSGDPMRQMPPLGPDGESLASASLARGKRQLLLDLREPSQLQQAIDLCLGADVVVESFRPGVAERLGIGPQALCTAAPQLVYCSLSGYGQTGPWAQHPGHDANYLSISGLLSQTGPEHRPTLPPVPLADLAGGSIAATAICAALLRRERTGVGAHIDLSLTEAALAWQPHSLAAVAAERPQREGSMLTGALASYALYECRDGRWLALSAIESKFFARVCELLGLDDLTDRQYDPAAQTEIGQRIAERIADRDASEWHELLADEQTCVTIVLEPHEIADHPQLTARGALTMLHADDRFPTAASPFVIDGQRSPSPHA